MIYHEVIQSDEYVAVVVKDKNVRKTRRKGGKAFGGDSDSEDEDEIKQRKEKEKREKEIALRGGISKEDEEALEAQAKVRAMVQVVVTNLSVYLDAIEVIVKGNLGKVSLLSYLSLCFVTSLI